MRAFSHHYPPQLYLYMTITKVEHIEALYETLQMFSRVCCDAGGLTAENRPSATARAHRHDARPTLARVAVDHDGQHDLDHVRRSAGQDRVPRVPVGHDGLHELPMSHEHGAAADAGTRRRDDDK